MKAIDILLQYKFQKIWKQIANVLKFSFWAILVDWLAEGAWHFKDFVIGLHNFEQWIEFFWRTLGEMYFILLLILHYKIYFIWLRQVCNRLPSDYIDHLKGKSLVQAIFSCFRKIVLSCYRVETPTLYKTLSIHTNLLPRKVRIMPLIAVY